MVVMAARRLGALLYRNDVLSLRRRQSLGANVNFPSVPCPVQRVTSLCETLPMVPPAVPPSPRYVLPFSPQIPGGLLLFDPQCET